MLINIFKSKNNKNIDNIKIEKNSYLKKISNAGEQLKERRIEQGISIKKLSVKTKISPNVIYAIENGVLDELPERAYLISMLARIEEELNLTKNSLKDLLKKDQSPKKTKKVRFLTFGSIDLIKSWHGNLVYFFLLFTSIVFLNKQQYDLTIMNGQTIQPFIEESDTNTYNCLKEDIHIRK